MSKSNSFEEPAYCMACGQRNGVYDETCRACGSPKCWVYPQDMSIEEIVAGQQRLGRGGAPARQQERPTGQKKGAP